MLAAGAVVAKDVPAYTLVDGISAKRLKIIENKLDKEDANEENT